MLRVLSGSIDPRDVSNGFYPHLRKVGPEDPDFLLVIQWLMQRRAPEPMLRAVRAQTVDGPGKWMPAELCFEPMRGDGGLTLDAALTFNFPHVALVELKKFFQFGDPNVLEMYPGLRPIATVTTVSPIGAAWPEQGPDCFRPADGDRFDYGTEFEDATGRYRKERRSWVFVSFGVWVKIH